MGYYKELLTEFELEQEEQGFSKCEYCGDWFEDNEYNVLCEECREKIFNRI